MATGKVNWFDKKKGYGFITPDDGGKDIFVHSSEIRSEDNSPLYDNQNVEYEIGEGNKGPCAIKVKPC